MGRIRRMTAREVAWQEMLKQVQESGKKID